MDSVTRIYSKLAEQTYDDDAVDKLSHLHSAAILLIFGVMVLANSFTGSHIQCWSPAHFTGNWKKYTNNYCWVKNTYYLPFEDAIPKVEDPQRVIPYYQWVPLILLLMAFFFWVPNMIWQAFSHRSGLSLPEIISSADMLQELAGEYYEEDEDDDDDDEVEGGGKLKDKDKGDGALESVATSKPEADAASTASSDDDVKPTTSHDSSTTEEPPAKQEKGEDKESEKILEYIVRNMHRYCMNKADDSARAGKDAGRYFSFKGLLTRVCCRNIGRSHGNYLILLCFCIKLLYAANVIGQLFALNAFLGQNFHLYGVEVIGSYFRGEDWTGSARFPRVTMCDLNVRRLGNVQRYTVQCVLPKNLFNEKIFLVIWFWLALVAILTVLNLFLWVWKNCFKTDSVRYIKRFFKHPPIDDIDFTNEKQKKKYAVDFTDKYLRRDGVFTLRMIEANTNAITTSIIVHRLYLQYRTWPGCVAEAESEQPNSGSTLPIRRS